jgi:hypothetical protein
MNALRPQALPIIRHCSQLTRNIKPVVDEQIEVECRVRIEGGDFFALFSMMTDAVARADLKYLGAVKQRDAIYRLPRRDRRTRICYHPTLNEPLFSVEKRSMLTDGAIDIKLANDYTLRIDAQKETFRDAGFVLKRTDAQRTYWRAKDRRSYVLVAAPLWQIDLTHVTQYNDGDDADNEHARVHYELEFELCQWALLKAPIDDMISQLESVVKFTLGV